MLLGKLFHEFTLSNYTTRIVVKLQAISLFLILHLGHQLALMMILKTRLSPTLSVPACCKWMEILFYIVLQRKTLMKNEVNEDGRVAITTPV
jgi:hypothetical protein